jgi:hypothetical protein
LPARELNSSLSAEAYRSDLPGVHIKRAFGAF